MGLPHLWVWINMVVSIEMMILMMGHPWRGEILLPNKSIMVAKRGVATC